VLCQHLNLAPYFLTIDFKRTKAALRNNINAKKIAPEYLAKGIPIIISPSGFVSTANKRVFSEVAHAPRTTFAVKLISGAQTTVVPVYFHGRKSPCPLGLAYRRTSTHGIITQRGVKTVW